MSSHTLTYPELVDENVRLREQLDVSKAHAAAGWKLATDMDQAFSFLRKRRLRWWLVSFGADRSFRLEENR